MIAKHHHHHNCSSGQDAETPFQTRKSINDTMKGKSINWCKCKTNQRPWATNEWSLETIVQKIIKSTERRIRYVHIVPRRVVIVSPRHVNVARPKASAVPDVKAFHHFRFSCEEKRRRREPERARGWNIYVGRRRHRPQNTLVPWRGSEADDLIFWKLGIFSRTLDSVFAQKR